MVLHTNSVVEHNSIVCENSYVGPSAVVCGNSKVGKNCLVGANSCIIEFVNCLLNSILGASGYLIRIIKKKKYLKECQQNKMKKIFVSTACLKGDKSYERVLETYINDEIKNIELTGVHPYLKFDELSKLINEYKNKGIQFTFHNYFPPPKDPIVLNYLSKNKKDKKDSEEIISKAIKLAKETQTSIYAYHPGYLREADINQKVILILKAHQE